MSFLTENPDLMIEALVVLVRRAGGSVTITKAEAPGPFNLLSKFDGSELHLVLEEGMDAYQKAQSGGMA